MLKDVKIGRRLGLAFGSVLLLTGAVCAAAYWGLTTMDSMAREVLKVAYPLVAQSQQARSSTLALRRFEKDSFLNIGQAEEGSGIPGQVDGAEADPRREPGRSRKARPE